MTRTLIDASLIKPFSGNFIGMGRNRIINGEMAIDQYTAGAVNTVNAPATSYGVDCMSGQGQTSDGVFTLQRSNATPPTGFSYFTRVKVTTADASVGTAQTYTLQNRIEGYMIRDFLYGTSAAKTATLSFWVRSSVTGTFGGSLYQSAGSLNCYVFTYTINAANTWEKKTVTAVGPTSGTFDNTNGLGLKIMWDIGCGTDQDGTIGSWTSGNFFRAAGNVRLISTLNATLDITGVQFEIGSVATEFEYRPFATELILCQRYFEKSYDLDAAVGSNAVGLYHSAVAVQINSTTMRSQAIYFKVWKRARPVCSIWATDGTPNKWNWVSTSGVNTQRTTGIPDDFFDHMSVSQTVALEYLAQGQWIADSRL